ncbi:MAG TPA: winged helix-turn-helix domain-containing protein, partial [Blastocatellia bacterium]|nr:winged helix-turn-helix domain-containing protein [Blastocatellia bacterium]HNG32653.1 winged helix-turn-helix domain-containing protein [Blastocatellia bacterium]
MNRNSCYQCYQFDDVRVDPQGFKVWRAGQPLPLEPKALAVLVFLLSNRDRLVEKQELLDEVWKDTFVTPNALTRVIAQLRKTLGDDAKEARYIETVPTRGYRFIADVEMVEAGLNGHAVASPPESVVEQTVSPPRNEPRAHNIAWFKLGLLLMTLPAIGFGWFWWKRPSVTAVSSVRQTRQLTANAGLDIFPMFSPDGSALVYASLRDGHFELFLRQLAPGGREIQLTADGADNLQPAWSPDGKQIVYHSRRRGGLWVIPALGGLARRLTEFGSRPAWSPDGATIAFQSDAPVDLSQTAFGALPPATLWLVDAGRGAARQLTKPGAPSGGHGAPAWSPDGWRIVFVSYDTGGSRLWMIPAHGGTPQLWREEQSLFFDPVFAPDGRHLYFSTAAGNFRLWQLPLDAGGNPMEPAIELANTGNSLLRHLSIAPDGKQIVYSALTADSNVASVALDPATHEAAAAPVPLTRDTNYRKTAQSFSPDGSTIAYSVWRLGADGEVWLMDADGKNARQLTMEPAGVLGWLPDGQAVALYKKNAANQPVLKVEISSGQTSPLTSHNITARFGRLSPKGDEIAFHQLTGGALNVWKAALSTGALTQLSFDAEMIGFPTWSPDG